MLMNPTIDKLRELKLTGMVKALEEQQASPSYQELCFEERLGLMVDREQTERQDRRFQTRLRQAKFRQTACMEDVDYRAARGLEKSQMLAFSSCQWIREKLNILVAGATGVGKSYIACALGRQVCLEGFKVLYFKANRLFQDLVIAKGDGSYGKLIRKIAKTHLIIIDDWGLSKCLEHEQRDFLEIIDERHGRQSTLVASQLPVSHWHEAMENPTIADAILDRLINSAYQINLTGDSMRKKRQIEKKKEEN